MLHEKRAHKRVRPETKDKKPQCYKTLLKKKHELLKDGFTKTLGTKRPRYYNLKTVKLKIFT